MSKKYAEEDLMERQKIETTDDSDIENVQVGRMDTNRLNMDEGFAQREKDNSEKLALAKVEQLRAEIRMMNEAKRQILEKELQDIQDQENREEEETEIRNISL